MGRIIIEFDAIEDIKNRFESLIQKSQKIDSTDFKKLVRPRTGFLDENEKMVFEYIKKNPGQSKQDVVNSLKNQDVVDSFKSIKPPKRTLSRNPVFDAITSLRERGMIIQKPDPSNVQRHLLYVNNENLILQVEKEIKDFKKSYLKLIKRADEEYKKKLELTEDELKESRRPDVDLPEFYSVGVSDGLIKIYKQVVTNYCLNAIFSWPQEIKDIESLNRLYLTVFQSLNEIFSELIKHVPFDIQDEHKRIEYLQEGLKYSIDDAKMYVGMIPEFDEYNVGPEFDPVMSNLFTILKMHMNWKDYRSGLNEYKSEYPL
jgi:hypothetical protein